MQCISEHFSWLYNCNDYFIGFVFWSVYGIQQLASFMQVFVLATITSIVVRYTIFINHYTLLAKNSIEIEFY